MRPFSETRAGALIDRLNFLHLASNHQFTTPFDEQTKALQLKALAWPWST